MNYDEIFSSIKITSWDRVSYSLHTVLKSVLNLDRYEGDRIFIKVYEMENYIKLMLNTLSPDRYIVRTNCIVPFEDLYLDHKSDEKNHTFTNFECVNDYKIDDIILYDLIDLIYSKPLAEKESIKSAIVLNSFGDCGTFYKNQRNFKQSYDAVIDTVDSVYAYVSVIGLDNELHHTLKRIFEKKDAEYYYDAIFHSIFGENKTVVYGFYGIINNDSIFNHLDKYALNKCISIYNRILEKLNNSINISKKEVTNMIGNKTGKVDLSKHFSRSINNEIGRISIDSVIFRYN